MADASRLRCVAGRIAKDYDGGHKLVAVLSAQGNTTDELIAKASELSSDINKREMDALISTGEQQSAALLAITLNGMGYPAISLSAGQAGICATSVYGNARIKDVDCERLLFETGRNNIVIVAGFQGINRYGDVVTIGRGGSDTTAVALAAVLGADKCEIYTDVDGVYTADPRIVPDAHKLNEISYEDMLELASSGACVLHNRSVELAKQYKVPLVVRSAMTDAPGTLVTEGKAMEKRYISGVAADKNTAVVSVIGIKKHSGGGCRLFSALAEKGISVGLITQAAGAESTENYAFTVTRQDLSEVRAILTEKQTILNFCKIEFDENAAKVSVVGAGMESNPGVASAVFEAISGIGVGIKMISTSEIKISIIVGESDADAAVTAIHRRFFSNPAERSNADE